MGPVANAADVAVTLLHRSACAEPSLWYFGWAHTSAGSEKTPGPAEHSAFRRGAGLEQGERAASRAAFHQHDLSFVCRHWLT